METTRFTTKMFIALAAAAFGLSAAPAEAQDSTVYRYASSLYYFWFPALSQPLYVDLVGHGLNGRSFNGKLLDGHTVVAVSLGDVQLQNGQHKDLELVGTVFGLEHGSDKAKGSDKGKEKGNAKNDDNAKAKLNKNQVIAAPGLIFRATLDDGDEVLLRVESVEATAAGTEGYLRYVVTYASENGWVPLCGTDEAGLPGRAVPLNGRWNYQEGVDDGGDFLEDEDTFTFACEGHVLAKCVDMGYPPWAQGKLCTADGKNCMSTTLAPWHQACTRLMRADFCGDGTSWTQDGTMVSVHDGIGIRSDQDAWALEAEWDENGARCAVRDRLTVGLEPPCMAALDLPTCGDPLNMTTGTRLVSEVPL